MVKIMLTFWSVRQIMAQPCCLLHWQSWEDFTICELIFRVVDWIGSFEFSSGGKVPECGLVRAFAFADGSPKQSLLLCTLPLLIRNVLFRILPAEYSRAEVFVACWEESWDQIIKPPLMMMISPSLSFPMPFLSFSRFSKVLLWFSRG